MESIEKAANKAANAVARAFAGGGTGGGAASANGAVKANAQVLQSGVAAANKVAAAVVDAEAIKSGAIIGSAAKRKLSAAQIDALEDRYLQKDLARTEIYQKTKAGQIVGSLAAKKMTAAQIDALEDRYIQKDIKRTADAENRRVQAARRTGDQLDAIQDRLIKRDYSRRIAFEAKKVQMAQAERNRAEHAFDGLVKGAAQFTLAMAGLESAGSVVNNIAEAFDRARESAYQSVQMVKDYRESLLELAALKDRLGDTSTEMKEQLLFRAKTLQSAADAREFQTIALGMGESAIDKPGEQRLVAPDEWEKHVVMGGQFQAVEGGDARAHAKLTGLMPTLIGRRTNAGEMSSKRAKLFNIMKPAGFEFTTGVDQLSELAPLIVSKTYALEKGVALMSAFGTVLTDKGKAGTAMQQFTRATIGAAGRMRGAKLEDLGYDVQKTGAYLKGLGVDEKFLKTVKAEDQPIEIGKRIAADLAKQEADATTRGEQFNKYAYLKAKGYGAQEEAESLLLFAGMQKQGTIDTFMKAAEAKEPTAEEAKAPIEKFRRSNLGQARGATIASEAANISAGAGTPEELAAAKEAAFASIRAKNPASMPFKGYGEVQPLGVMNVGNVLFGYKLQIQREAVRLLEEEAKRVGAEIPDKRPFQGVVVDTAFTDKRISDLQTAIRRRGGNIAPGLEGVVKAAEQSLDAAKAREDLGNVKVPPPVIPQPAAPAAIPGPGAMIGPGEESGHVPMFGLRTALAATMIGGLPDVFPQEPAIERPRGSLLSGPEDSKEVVAILREMLVEMRKDKKEMAPPAGRRAPTPLPCAPRAGAVRP